MMHLLFTQLQSKVKAQQFQVNTLFSKNTVALGFTKGNELFVGRLAMLGFASALVGEVSNWVQTMRCGNRSLPMSI